MKTSCGKFLNLAHYFPYDVKLRLLAHSRSFLAYQKARNAIVEAKNLLNGDGAWSTSNNKNANDYLQIDLLYEFVICAVAIQGEPSADHWTKTYKLQLSYSSSNWVIYQENSADKVGMSYELREVC